jgi:hypothetical protein
VEVEKCELAENCKSLVFLGACSAEQGYVCQTNSDPESTCTQSSEQCSGHRSVTYCSVDELHPESGCIAVAGIPVACPGDVDWCDMEG